MRPIRIWFTAVLVATLLACGGGKDEASSSKELGIRKTAAHLLANGGPTAVKNIAAGVNNVPAVAGNVLVNPGFENGAAGWTQASTGGYDLVSAFSQQTANTGTQIAWLGGYDSGTDTLSQDVLISGTGTQAKLQFWYKISTSELTSSEIYDIFLVELYSASTGLKLATLATYSNLDATTGWTKSPQYDVSAYIGQQVRIKFTAVLDVSASSSMLIDDVSLALQDFTAITPQNGWWWNPTEGGRGFAIERQGNQIFLAAFLYEANGTATWHVSTMTRQTNGTYTGDLLRYTGGQTLLGAYKSPATPSTVALALLTFDSPTSGTLDIQQTAGTTARSIALERFPISTPAFAAPNASFESGWWWNEAQGGRGFFVEVQGSQAFIGGFMYDATGQPIWYVSTANLSGSQSVAGALQQYGGGQTLISSYKSPSVVSSTIGSIGFNFTSASAGAMVLPNGSSVSMKRFIFNTASTEGTATPGTPSTLASFAGTYTITTTGLTVTFVVDTNGNVTRCTSGALLVCSGNVSATGAFTIRGNDGESPIDTTATATGTISANGGVVGTYSGNSVSDGALSGSFTGSRITVSGTTAPSYQTAYNTCYNGTPDLYSSIYCTAYANAMVAGSTPQSANQAGANAAGSNVGNIGTGQPVSSVGTPNTGGSTTTACVAPKITYNNACVTPAPSLSFSKTALNYAPQPNGTTSAAQSITLTNTGNTGILLKRQYTLPLFAKWTVVNDTCPAYDGTVFPAGASCIISINFTPYGDDNKLGAYMLQQSLGQNPAPIPNETYTGVYEAWGDSVTNPQLPVPKATFLLNGIGVYPIGTTTTPTTSYPNALSCLTVTRASHPYSPDKYERVTFKNQCNKQIFILWCGDLRFETGNTCGKNATNYYSHSSNMIPGELSQTQEKDVLIGGQIRYAACYGGIGFGNNGDFKAYPDGSFLCLKPPK